MPACADLRLCKLPNRPLGEKDGQGCRLGCGGRLHGICGKPEEEGGREINRVCNPCIAKKQKTPDSSNQPRRASPNSGLVGDGKPNNANDSESSGGGGKKAPPSFAELADLFGPLELYADSCGIGEAGHYPRQAKTVFFTSHSARPER